MAYLQVGTENSSPIKIHYEDYGTGTPMVLIHGWPLSGRSWEKQIFDLLEEGFRVITYDRRGFGKSSQPSIGYDANTLAADLDALMSHLDLRQAVLVGFSMGGVEVARYLGKYGTDRVSKAVFIGAVTPFLLKTKENPEGVDRSQFDDIRVSLFEDRPKFLTSFFKDFYNTGLFDGISEEAVKMSWLMALEASPIATMKVIDAWLEDFRPDLKSLDITVLVVHGDSDKTVPIKASGARMKEIIPHCVYHPLSGAPHGLNWTHAEVLNQILLDFIGPSQEMRAPLNEAHSVQGLELH